jgi:hypothetical protein
MDQTNHGLVLAGEQPALARMMTVERTTYVRNLSQWLYHKQSPFPGAWLAPLQLPGIRAFWSNTGSDTTRYDLTALGCTATSDGAAVGIDQDASWPGVSYWYTNNARIYAQKVAAWPALQISGSVTVGAWIRAQAASVAQNVMQWGEYKSYGLAFPGTAYRFDIKPAAAALMSVTSGAIDTGVWNLVIGRYTVSTEMSVFVSGVQVQSTTSIPAVLGGGDYFQILGNIQPSESLHVSQMWVCAYAVPDHALTWLYKTQQSIHGR